MKDLNSSLLHNARVPNHAAEEKPSNYKSSLPTYGGEAILLDWTLLGLIYSDEMIDFVCFVFMERAYATLKGQR